MKQKTVNNLVVSGSILLGISYIIVKCMKNNKNKNEIKINQTKELSEEISNNSRTYYKLGEIIKKDGKLAVKKLRK